MMSKIRYKSLFFAVFFSIALFMTACSSAESATKLRIGKTDIKDCETQYYYTFFLRQLAIDPTTDQGKEELAAQTGDKEYPTVEDYIWDSVVSEIQRVELFLSEAQKENYNISDEEVKNRVDKETARLKEIAEGIETDFPEYLEIIWGTGFSEEDLSYVLTRMFSAEIYYEETLSKKFEPTENEIIKQYEDNKEKYDRVNYRAFEFKYDEDNKNVAQMIDEAQKMLDELTDEKSFSQLSYKYASEEAKEIYKEDNVTLFENVSSNVLKEEFSEWLFSSKREQGDKVKIDSAEGSYVLYFISRTKPAGGMINLREFLMEYGVTSDGEVNEDEAVKKRIREKAESLKAEIKNEDDFIKALEENSTSGEDLDAGGLYENIARGDQAEEITEWGFDPKRKEGDVEIVEIKSGIAFLYFVNKIDEEEWKHKARLDLRAEKYEKYLTKNFKKYKLNK